MKPIFFKENLHTLVWGTEEWSVSAVESSPSVVDGGEFADNILTDIIAAHPVEILGQHVAEKYDNQLPLLAKIIDAHQNLSIQVHPNDEMAAREHGKRGKTEMWYIIDAEPDAFIYSGFKKELTAEEYKRQVENGQITDSIARHEAHKGDVFYLPAGRVHAICGGIRLAEIQQSSDVTYRIYDYGRKGLDGKPRELHTELAAQAINFKVEKDYRTTYPTPQNSAETCVDSDFFTVNIIESHRLLRRDLREKDSFIILMCLDGACVLRFDDETEVQLTAGQSILIPAQSPAYTIEPTVSVNMLEAYC